MRKSAFAAKEPTSAPPSLFRISDRTKVRTLFIELRIHAPFTALGAASGIVIMLVIIGTGMPAGISASLFWFFHPIHVLLSALVTAGMYRLHSRGRLLPTILIGYFGSVGIATLSDCVIPYLGELCLSLPGRGVHLGVIEKWWLVNPLAFAGIALARFRPGTRLPHAGHVLLSTWASLFHMTMALGARIDSTVLVIVPLFLFLAVWLPCCTSDIVFPLLFARGAGYHTRPPDVAALP